MRSKFNTARAYLAFDQIALIVEGWISVRVRPLLGYSSEQITSRIAQRFVEIGLVPFLQNYAQFNLPTQEVNISGITISATQRNEDITVSLKITLQGILDFSLHWFHILVMMLINTFKFPVKSNEASTLIFGVGSESIVRHGTDAEFIQYCKMGPLGPLNQASSITVQFPRNLTSARERFATYTRFPLLSLVKKNPPNFLQFGAFCIAHIKAAVAFFSTISHCSLATLIGRDFAYHAMVCYLNDQSLIESVVITNSNYSAQPLWMRPFTGRNFKTHMVYYSQNTIPFTYRDDPISAALPNSRHICVDVSWTWTKAYADYLQSIGVKAEVNIVGPIVWYMPKLHKGSNNSKNIRVMVFDVTPVIDEFAKKIGLLNNYYSAENCIRFIEDIVSVVDNLENEKKVSIELILKHKRGHHNLHDKNYINLIANLCSAKRVDLVEYEADIFELIALSDLVIVIPYSSPVIIANLTGVPSVYFDSTQELVPENREGSLFASGKDELTELIEAVICQSDKIHNALESRGT